MFGVSSIDEALQLREAAVNAPILTLGAVPVWSFDNAAVNSISLSVFSQEHIEAARQTYQKTGIRTKAHIKIDTGMNRIGVRAENAVDFIKKVRSLDFIQLEGIFTHFAAAEKESYTKKQYEKFSRILDCVDTRGLVIHCCNTAALIAYNQYCHDMARVGIGIYGLQPDLPENVKQPDLLPALSLKGRITNIHKVHAKEGISYSCPFETEKETTIATIPTGYADGISRCLSNKIYGILNGKKIKQTGNITMDQMMFDITGCEAKEGDIITLIGEEGNERITVDEWAKILGTIHYEITCNLRVRLPRVYTR
jgi:alanine racemase